jgi:hypothetical protein
LLAKDNRVLKLRLDAVFHQGKNEGLREAIRKAGEFLSLAIDDSKQEQLDKAEAEELGYLLTHFRKNKAWPPSTKVSSE